MKLRKLRQDILRFTGYFVITYLVDVLCKTLKVTCKNRGVIDALKAENKNFVLAFWHGSMLLPWYTNRKQGMVSLTSKSKDGDLLAKVLKHWKYRVIRGSSSTGGDVALGMMIDYARNKRSITITPDGPRGPRHKMKAGAVITAKKSGLPLILVGVGIKKSRNLSSWDKFEIPGLFTKAVLVYSDPVYVPNDLSYEDTSAVIEKCEILLNKLQEEARNSL